MKIFTIILAIMLFMSCALINDNQSYKSPKIEIVSEYLFSMNGKVLTDTISRPPFTIYNPNLYDIIISIDGTEYTVNSHENLTINTP